MMSEAIEKHIQICLEDALEGNSLTIENSMRDLASRVLEEAAQLCEDNYGPYNTLPATIARAIRSLSGVAQEEKP